MGIRGEHAGELAETFENQQSPGKSPPACAAAVACLKVVQLCLERLDRAVRHLEVLVETVALLDEL